MFSRLEREDDIDDLLAVKRLLNVGDVTAAAISEARLGDFLERDGVLIVDILRPELPVICISGHTEESMAKEMDTFADLRFLAKPFSLQGLAGMVKDGIDSGDQSAELLA